MAIGVAMWWLDMPNPLLFGVIGFVFNFVPYLGAVVGVFIVAVVGLVSFDSLGQALLPALVYFALTSSEGQLITPHLLGRRLEMNPVVVFVSVALWASLWSVMGMLVAVPLLVTIRAFCEHIPQLEPVGKFLSARGRELINPGAGNGPEGMPDRSLPGGRWRWWWLDSRSYVAVADFRFFAGLARCRATSFEGRARQ